MKANEIYAGRIRSLSLFFQPFAVSAFLWLIMSPAAHATTYNWTNTLGGNWNISANWSPTGVPGASDTAVISSNGTYTVTVSDMESAGTLTMSASSGTQTLNISGGTLTINNASTGNANAILEVSGGTLTGAGSLTLAGPLDWSGGIIKSVVQCNGGTFSGSPALDDGQIINVGTLTWNSPAIGDGAGSVISNASSGIINVTGTGGITRNNYGTPQTFYNAGQLNISASGTSATFVDNFVNSGTNTINAGTADFGGNVTNVGTISVMASTAAWQFGGSLFTNSATISGTGNLILSAGTVDLGGTVTISGTNIINGAIVNVAVPFAPAAMSMSSGTMSNNPVTVTGPLTWSGGTIKNVVQCNGGTFSGSDLLDGGQIINIGTLAWNGPEIFDGAGSVISNASSGTINVTGTGTITLNNYGAPQTFYNAGQLNISASGTSATFADNFVNSGTNTINAGTADFEGDVTNVGTISVTASTAAWQFGGSLFTNSARISDMGNLILSSGTVYLGGTITVGGTNIISGGVVNVVTSFAPAAMAMSNGTISNNPVTVTGPLTWSAGTIKNVVQCNGGAFSGSDFLDGGQIINTGTLAWNNPTIYDGAGSVISNAASGTINVTGGNDITENDFGPPETFYNAGQLNISNSGNPIIFADDFVNSYMTAINAGTVSFNGGGTNLNTISVTAGTAALEFAGGTFTNATASTISDDGNLIFNSGTVGLAGTVTVGGTNIFSGATVNITGNYPITTPLVISSGTVTFNGSGTWTPTVMIMSGGTLETPVTVSGLLTWSGGTIKSVVQCNGGAFSGSDFLDGGQIINTGTLAWNNPTIYDGAGSVISNAASGTINVTGGNDITENDFSPPQTFYNAGQLNISNSGNPIIFADDFVNSYMTAINAGTVSFNGGGTNLNTISVTAGTAALEFAGGTFTNTTTSTISDDGSLIFNSGTVDLAGTVTVDVTNIFSGATVNITGNYPITTLLAISGGTTTFSGSGGITPSAMTMSGGTIMSNSITVSGALTWSGGTIKNAVHCNGGTFSGSPELDGGQIINTGTLAWNSPTILDGAGSVISNAASGTINVTGTGNITQNNYNAPQFLYNAGQLNVSSSGSATIDDIFLNSGTTTMSAGTFTSQNGTTNTGTMMFNGGILDLSGAHSLAGGTLNFGINALNNYGSNVLAGASALAGTLSSTFNGSYLPAVGNTYNIMTYGSSSGSFTKTNLSPLAVWSVSQGSTALSITVLKLVPQMSWAFPAAIVYGTALSGTQLDATATWNGSAVPGTFIYNPPLGTVLDSGSNQTLSVTFTPADMSTYTNVTTNVLITVQQAPLTVTATNQSKTYGQTFNFAGTEFTTIGLVNGDTATSATISSPGAAPTAAVAGSPYTITITNATGTAGLTNYVITYDTGTLAVNAAPLTVTANNRIKTYGQTVTFAGTEFTPSGLRNGEMIGSVTLTSTGTVATASVAGSPYNIVPSAATGGTFNPANYTITYDDGTLTVNATSLTITADNTNKIYGKTIVFAGTEFTTNGLQNGETIGSVTLTSTGTVATASVAGSPYNIVPSAATGGTFNPGNYAITYDDGTLTVSTASLTITANNTNKIYGKTIVFAGTEFTTNGLQNGETVGSVTLTSTGTVATASVAGSPYNIVPSAAIGGTFNPANYTITYDNGTLTVNTASLTITADNTNKIYGQTVTFTGTEFTSSGLQNGETIGTVTLTSSGTPSTAAVGPYNIVPSAPTGGTFNQVNYSDGFVDGTLTVFGQPSLTLMLTMNGTSNVLTFPTVIGETYQLESSTNLLTGWTSLGSPIPGTGASVNVTNTITSLPTFYLLQIQN